MNIHDATEQAYTNGFTDGYSASAVDAKMEIDRLNKQIDKLTAERDAAVADLKTIAKKLDNPCDWCANYSDVKLTLCMMCDDEEHNGNFEWRGV